MRRLKRLPQNTPIRLPNVEITKEVKPMMTIGERIEESGQLPLSFQSEFRNHPRKPQ
jgi:hypothetical protein